MPARDHDDLRQRLDYPSVTDYAKNHPDLDGEAIGRALTRGATKAELLAWAVGHVGATVEGMRRAWARMAEDRAAEAAARRRQQEEADRQQEEAATRQTGCYQALFDDPTGYPGNVDERRQFRRWAGDRFGEWYERGHELAEAAGERKLRLFEADWHPGGVHAYYDYRRAEQVIKLVHDVADEVRLETTRELLCTLFALGDGATVTWGAATVDQHEQRIAMLAKNAAGVVETAARHQAAIRMIKDAGVECLADLAGPDDDGPAPVPA